MVGMQMGLNRYRLLQGEEHAWYANVTLPVCSSGRSDWIAEFELTSGQQRFMFTAPFSLAR